MPVSRLNIKDYSRFLNKQLKDMEINDTISILTFKRDRKIKINKLSQDNFNIIEDGFKIREFINLTEKEAIKTLIKLKDIEYPRSNTLFIERK